MKLTDVYFLVLITKPKHAYLILGGRLIGSKNNRKPSSGRPIGSHGQALNRGSTVFKLGTPP